MHVSVPHEAWIATDQQGKVRVMITGPHGFQRTVTFPPDETPGVITEMVRATLDEGEKPAQKAESEPHNTVGCGDSDSGRR